MLSSLCRKGSWIYVQCDEIVSKSCESELKHTQWERQTRGLLVELSSTERNDAMWKSFTISCCVVLSPFSLWCSRFQGDTLVFREKWCLLMKERLTSPGIGKKIVFEPLLQRCLQRLTHSRCLGSQWRRGGRLHMKHYTLAAGHPYLQGFKIVTQRWECRILSSGNICLYWMRLARGWEVLLPLRLRGPWQETPICEEKS